MKLVAILAVAACHQTPAVVAPPPATVPPPPPAADPHAATVDALVGVWAGKAIGTPYGDFPFALAFDRRADGAVHGHIESRPGMYLDFTFRRAGGAWVLDEEGAIPNVGTQRHTLAATGA